MPVTGMQRVTRDNVAAQPATKLEQVSNAKMLAQLWLDASPDPMVWIDLNGCISAANQAACEFSGMNMDALIGTPAITLASEPSPKRLQKGMARLWINASTGVFSTILPLRMGLEPKRYMRMRVVGTRDGVKRLLAVSLTDVTDLVMARRLARRQALRGRKPETPAPLQSALAATPVPAPAPARRPLFARWPRRRAARTIHFCVRWPTI
jgi:PAS domain S-box-containing protein